MDYPYPIRLHGPYQLETSAGTQTVRVPSLGEAWPADRVVRYRRRFGRPTGIDPHESVWLVVAGIDPRGNVLLNETPLGAVSGYAVESAWEVTDRLNARNELLIEIDPADLARVPRPGREGAPGGLVASIRLEIRCRDFLARPIVRAAPLAGGGIRVSFSASAHIVSGDAQLTVRAAQRECACLTLERGQPGVELSLDVPEWPAWSPGNAPDAVFQPFDFRLAVGGSCVWQHAAQLAWRTAQLRTIQGDPARQVLAVVGSSFGISPVDPLPVFDPSGPPRSPGLHIARQIFDEDCYDQADRRGDAILQCLPLEWLGSLPGHLFRHPCIVAATVAGSDEWIPWPDGVDRRFQRT